jgi:hypothetical protein
LSKDKEKKDKKFATKYGSYTEDQYFDVRLQECNNDTFSDTQKGECLMGDVIKLEKMTCSDRNK